MRSVSICCATLLSLVFCDVVYAVPTAFYNAATGAIWLVNDAPGPLWHISMRSAGGNLRTDPSFYATFPGATFDPSDLPAEFTYLSYPHTNSFSDSFVGNVVIPGTPQSDLSGVYRESLNGPPLPVQFIWSEPSSSAIGVVGALAFVSLSRRFRTPVSERVE